MADASNTPDVVNFGLIVADSVATKLPANCVVLDDEGKAFVHIPVGDLAGVEGINTFSGGNVPNCGIPGALLGVSNGAVAWVGRDNIGNTLIQSLAEAGMDTKHVIQDPTVNTSATLILNTTDPNGKSNRTFVHASGGHGDLTKDKITDEIIDYMARAKILNVGYFGILPKLLDDLPEMLRRVREKNEQLRQSGEISHAVKICLDTGGNQDAMAKEGFIEKLKETLKFVDIFMPSFDEAKRFTGRTDKNEIVNTLRGWGVREIAGVKMGADGAYAEQMVSSPGQGLFVPSFHLDNVVDTTGAGDSFVGGFIAARVAGKDLETCMRIGHACGAVCVGYAGASTGIKELMKAKQPLPGELGGASQLLLDFAAERAPLKTARGGGDRQRLLPIFDVENSLSFQAGTQDRQVMNV